MTRAKVFGGDACGNKTQAHHSVNLTGRKGLI
jgi:hypothetical protein